MCIFASLRLSISTWCVCCSSRRQVLLHWNCFCRATYALVAFALKLESGDFTNFLLQKTNHQAVENIFHRFLKHLLGMNLNKAKHDRQITNGHDIAKT